MTTNIYVICPEYNAPSGGIKKLHDHVTSLRELGFAAYIVHEKPGFRCDWFSHSASIRYLPHLQVNPADVLVIPEVYGPEILSFYPGIRKVIYCQNSYNALWGFKGTDLSLRDVYRHPDVIRVVVNSEQDRLFFAHLFPRLPVFRVHNGIDAGNFHYVEEKKPQIACIPLKLPKEALLLRHVLEARGATDGYTLRSIEGMDYQSYAQVLRESLLFLAFSHNEGFGLPPAEAMACGCLVVGYDGTGGKEYFTREVGFPVPYNDILLYAQTVEEVIKRHRAGDDSLGQLRRNASRYILRTYPVEREKNDILMLWHGVLAEMSAQTEYLVL